MCKIILSLLLTMFIYTGSYASEIISTYDHSFNQLNDQEKYYIQEDQIYISNDHITVLINQIPFTVPQINVDENGIFVFVAYFKCPNGHEIRCTRCGGCARWDCQFKCWCKK